MKKVIATLLVLTMVISFAGCKKKGNQGKDSENNPSPTQSQGSQGNTQNPNSNPGGNTDAQDGRVTDPTKLGESITYWVEGDYLYFKIKTSAEIDVHHYNIDIVNPGFYLTRDSELITQVIYDEMRCFAEKFDKEYFEGYYVFAVDNIVIAGLASDESKWAPGTWSVLLYNEDTGLVLGQWLIVLEGGGKYHFEYKDSWLYGAGEDRKVKEFDSLEDEVTSWFTFSSEESYDEWATFYFNGYYLEQIDPYGYDSYYLMVCPEGDYTTYEEAKAVDLTECGYGGRPATCPYHFAFEQDGLENGKYTMVLARSGRNDLGLGGKVEVQFAAEKKGPKNWVMDFSNAKCPALESKYGVQDTTDITDVPFPDGDPAEYSREYWEAKYPGENICPFYIEENGTEYSYYWISGLEGWDGTMTSWLKQPFNWNGWHMTADGCIVNKEETLKVTDDWSEGEGMSSCCTVTTEKYDKDSKQDGSYVFNPPTDNFYVEVAEYHDGTAYQCITSKKGNVFTCEDEYSDRRIKYDYNAETAYLDDWNQSYGWSEDGEWFWDADSYEEQTAEEFYFFDEYFMSYFEGFGFGAEDLERYCVGNEVIAGCNCWIFDAKGFNGNTDKYWVNMENGICMKCTDQDGEVDFVITKLDLNY